METEPHRRLVTRVGLQLPSFTIPGVADEGLFDRVAEAAVAADESGFDSLWVMDHFYQLPVAGSAQEPMFEAYTLLGALAARTRTVHLGALVTGVTYRNPAILAKIVTALDVISGGRAILGIGAAWYEQEHDGLGVRFPSAAERLDRLEEALQVCRAMFTEETPSFEGRYYQVHEAINHPRPVRPAGIPILVGGGGERRTLRLVAQYADASNVFGDADVVRHKLQVLDAHCQAVGRDPAAITRTRLGTLAIAPTRGQAEQQLARAAEAGWRPAYLDMAAVCTPDQLADEVGRLLQAGLDGVIYNLVDAYDPEIVALAGRTLASLVS